jgi:UDP-N-acetylmuramyl tripeptide synthase
VLSELRALGPRRVLTLFGCGGDRDKGKRPLMGAAAAAGSDLVVVTSDNPRSEDPRAILADILPGVGAAPHLVVEDRREAIAAILARAEPGDIVLLAGKGHEATQTLGAEVLPFSDADVAAEVLA